MRVSRLHHRLTRLVLAVLLLCVAVEGQTRETAPSAEQHYEKGVALLEQQQIDAALSEFREAVRLKPDAPGAHYYLGYALGVKGSLSEAIAEYEVAVRLKPDFAEAQYYLGAARWFTNDIDGAIEALTT